ncbi:MAG: 50S ribosomal protein L4 [Chitinophagales bacterium]
MKLEVVNISGAKTGRSVELNEEIFGIEPNDHSIYLTVKQYLANQRQGTHKSKERSEIAGSTRKLHRQKGTGGSRKGDIKNPLFHGGGTVFGPKPRDYSFKLNAKLKELARRSAFSYKAKENRIIVVEDLQINAPKTKVFASLLKAVGADKSRSLFVLGKNDLHVRISGRNIPNTAVALADNLNTYEIMKAHTLILAESAVAKINQMVPKN